MKAITKNLEFCGIYMLLNTKNGKRYIGSSINIRQRLWEHRVYYKDGSFIGKWDSMRKASEALNLSYSSVRRVLNNKMFQVKGYRFFKNKQENITPFNKPTNSNSISKIYIVDDGINKLELRGVKEVAAYFNTSIYNISMYLYKKIKFHKKYMIYPKSAV